MECLLQLPSSFDLSQLATRSYREKVNIAIHRERCFILPPYNQLFSFAQLNSLLRKHPTPSEDRPFSQADTRNAKLPPKTYSVKKRLSIATPLNGTDSDSSEDALLLTAKPGPSTKQSSFLFGREPPARLRPLEGTAVEPKPDPAPLGDFSLLTALRGDTTEGIETALNVGVKDQQLDPASLLNPPLAPSSLSLPLVSSQTSRHSHYEDHPQNHPPAYDTPSDPPAQTTLSVLEGSSQSCSTASSQDSGASSASNAIRPGSTFLTPQPSLVPSHSPLGTSPSAGSLAETARALFNLEQHQLDNLARFGGLVSLSHSPSESGRLCSPVFARASGAIDEKGVESTLEYISQPLDPSVTTVRRGNGDIAGTSERSAVSPIDHWDPRQPSKSPPTGRDSNRSEPKPNSSPQPAIKSQSDTSPSETSVLSTSKPPHNAFTGSQPLLYLPTSAQTPQDDMALGKRRSLRIVESDPEPDSDSEVVKATTVKPEVSGSKGQKRDKPKQKEESAAGPSSEPQRKSKRRSIAPVLPNEPPYESAPPAVPTPERRPQLKRPPTPPIDSPPGTEVQRPPTPPLPITPLPQVETMPTVEADAAIPVQKSGGKRPAELEVKEPLRKKRKSAVPPEDKDEPMGGNAASGENKEATVEKGPEEKKGLKIKLKVQPKSTSTSKSTSPAPSHAESTAGSDGRSVESGRKSARGLRAGRRSSARFNPDDIVSEGTVDPPVMPAEARESPVGVPEQPTEVKSKGKKLSKEKKPDRSGGQGSATEVSAKQESNEVLAPVDILPANPKAVVGKENPGTAGKRRPRRIVESSPEKEDDKMDVDVDDLFGDEAPSPGPVTASSIPALMAKEGRGEGSVVRSVKAPSETSASPSKATKVEPRATTVNPKDDALKAKEDAPANPKPKDEANSKPKDEANSKPKDEAKRTLPKLTKKKPLPTDSPGETAPPVVKKKLLDKSSASTPQSAVFKKKKPLAGSSKGTTPVPAMSFLQSTMAALSQKRERDGGDKTDKGKKEKEKEKEKRKGEAWGGEWVLTAEQQAEFEAARPEREAARKIRDGWKVNAVNLQESKDAYRIDSVQRRVLPLAGIQPTPSTTPSAFAARLWEMDNDAIF